MERKTARIYRSNKSLNGAGTYNTYLQYFNSIDDAIKAYKYEDKWNCKSVQIEELDELTKKWKVFHRAKK